MIQQNKLLISDIPSVRIFQLMQEIVFQIDPDGHYIYVNDHFLKLFDYSEEEIHAFLVTNDYPFHKINSNERAGHIATYLSKGKIIGHFSGRLEFGPRALGARSILGDPRDLTTQTTLI